MILELPNIEREKMEKRGTGEEGEKGEGGKEIARGKREGGPLESSSG